MNRGIQRFFSQVPSSYELINRVITLGLDAFWRRKAVNIAVKCPLAVGNNGTWLDICSGTGQMARLLRSRTNSKVTVVAADFSIPMLLQAKNKIRKGIQFSGADALVMPFRDNTFDLITIGFATRNLCAKKGQLLPAFSEFQRVLKPGGCFLNVETSQPGIAVIRRIFHRYVQLTVRPVGRWLSGSDPSYAYLASSIQRFYGPDQLVDVLKSAGFNSVTYKSMLLGAVAVHRSVK